MSYTFGDTDAASLRLRLLADVYAHSSRDFVLSLGLERPHLCIDLGCGPGLTTAMLHRALSPSKTLGLDQSEPFIALARQQEVPGLEFLRHDVTSTPFPSEAAALLYCRFLLTHLRQPSEVLTRWLSCTAPSGVLALEELEHMRSDHPVLSEYYGIVLAMQSAHGQEMYIGKRLESIVEETPWRVHATRLHRFDIPVPQMARLHHLNIQTWKHNAFITGNYSRGDIDRLESHLGKLAEDASTRAHVDYGMRQMVCHRAAPA